MIFRSRGDSFQASTADALIHFFQIDSENYLSIQDVIQANEFPVFTIVHVARLTVSGFLPST
jgi:hypothetical protein